MVLPAHIVTRIQEVIVRGHGRGIDEEARRHGAIALMGTIGGIWMLRPDGSFWDADMEWRKPLTPLPSDLHITALVAGTERYPWLAELLPPRPVDARDCMRCGGRGTFVPSNALPGSDGVFCPECKALGWEVSPNSRP
jgi:hypothetical protein